MIQTPFARRYPLWARVQSPSKKNRRVPVAHDPAFYRRRKVVERYFRRLKNQRKLALRTDKTKAAFLAWVWVAEAVDILKTKS